MNNTEGRKFKSSAVSSNYKDITRRTRWLKVQGLDLLTGPLDGKTLYLDNDKIEALLFKLGDHLNFEDLMAVKSEINQIS
jgi:hypothetical protein